MALEVCESCYTAKGLCNRAWQTYPLAVTVCEASRTYKYIVRGRARVFDSNEIRELPARKRDGNKEETENDGQASMFVCPEKGCNNAFDSFGELELHIDVGVHETPNRKKESVWHYKEKLGGEVFFHRFLSTYNHHEPAWRFSGFKWRNFFNFEYRMGSWKT